MNLSPSTAPSATTLGADTRSVEALRSSAARDPKGVIREAAKQFEALFMQQLMKSMRDATLASGMLDNSGSQLGTEMLDAQFATQMSGLKGGLGEVIARQLERQMGGVAEPAADRPAAPAAAAGAALPGNASPLAQRQAEFVRQHQEAAREAERQSGIPAAFMVGQAAHESAWGRKEIKLADGTPSHNLFGIKATPGWTGAVAEVTTTEYINGAPRKVTARFRAYDSHAESFADYARLLQSSPRYAGVVASLGNSAASPQTFAQGLQRAGYATDPAYADKLTRVINTALRMQRAIG